MLRLPIVLCSFLVAVTGCDQASTPNDSGGPCADGVCSTPPANSCLDEQTLRAYAPLGICTDGSCSYDYTDSTCVSGCQDGACIGDDPCNGVTCNRPPAPTCTGPDSLRSYSSSGTCSLGNCSYAMKTTTCTNGCQSGACAGDSCGGVICDHPPASSCVTSTTLRTYASTGTCNGGRCSYTSTDMTCSSGCAAGSCKDPCAGVACNQPPAPTCSSSTMLRTYSSSGSCAGGSCSYASSDSMCQFGCQSGACIPVAVSQCPPPPTPTTFVPTVSTRTGISSPNASATAVYVSTRLETALRSAGAFSATEESVLTRVHGYSGSPAFGVDMLLFAEAASRWPTFTAPEQATFPHLWQLLQVATPSETTLPGAFPTMASLIAQHDQMAPLKLDVNARTQISLLPSVLQPAANHVLKTAGAAAGTVSFAEVRTALASYANYPSSEYFRFGALLRAIEALAVTPATFPNLEILGPIDQTQMISVGSAAISIARTRSKASCVPNTFDDYGTIQSSVSLSLTVPSGTTLVWVPLTANVGLSSTAVANQYVFTSGASALTSSGAAGNPWEVAIAEAWQAGQRTAQIVVRVPNGETVSKLRYAIVQNGQFLCRPTDQEASATSDLASFMTLPPGRYVVPAGSYGSATLDLFGLNLYKLTVLTQSFWKAPDQYYVSYWMCWPLTSLGPTNDATCGGGPGPGFRLVDATGDVYFLEQSYGICPSGGTSGGGGTKVITLTEASRQ